MDSRITQFTEDEYQQFFSWIFGREDIKLEKEYDISRSLELDRPYIYYTPEIKAFFETPAMKRIGKIGQTANVNLIDASAFEDRLEHCKGAYQKILDFYMLQYKKEEWRNNNSNEDSKLKVLADIMDMASHDIGHNICSHALENLIGTQKGAHEVLGNRIIHENPEVKEAFSNIHPRLMEYLDIVKNPEYNLYSLKEGNIDFDRADFLSRDSLYVGLENGYENSSSNKSIPVLLDSITKGCTIIPITYKGKEIMCPVYSYEVVPHIEAFLERRNDNYNNIYISANNRPNDSVLESFCKAFLESDETVAPELKDYLVHISNSKIEDIDINEYLSWNDIRFYNTLFDIAENAKDENIKKYAMLCLPSVESMVSIIQHKILSQITPDIDENGNEIDTEGKLGDEERKFYLKVKDIVEKHDDRFYINKLGINCLGATFNSVEEMEEFNEYLKTQVDSNCVDSLIPWRYKSKIYDKKEPIFILGEDKKIYTFDEYPNRKLDIDVKERCIVLGIVPKMLLNGVPEDQIRQLREAFSNLQTGKRIDFSFSRKDTRLNSELMDIKYNAEDER